MQPSKAGLIIATMVILQGCGSTGSVLKMGPDTYRVSASRHNMAGGSTAAEADALQTANSHCQGLSKEVLVTNTSSDFDRPFYNYTATFQCLNSDDPGLHRPQYRPAPTTVIEDRRQ